MFPKSRSSRLKIALYPNSQVNLGDLHSRYQLKIAFWEYLLYAIILLGDRHAKNFQKLGKLFIYILFIVLGIVPRSGVSAQPNQPLTPDRDIPPQPQPLPPRNNPLNDSLDAPPLPESVLDIPGTIVVDRFTFVGSTVFEEAELNKAIASFTGKPISFAQLVQAASAITQLYVRQGYITSGAYLPTQNLSSGTVQIQVVEGTLSDIEINIEEGRLTENYIRDRLENRISTPLNINQVQSALQLIQLNPLIASLDAELSTGIQPGTNALKVSVIGADTFTLQARVNNNRNPTIGSFERGIKLSEANLLGIGDEFNLSFFNTEGSNQYGGDYTLPLNSRDGTLSFDFRLAQNEIIEADFEEIDIDIESRSYNLTWRQPIIQKATPEISREFALNIAASRRESDTSLLDTPTSISPGGNARGEIRTSALSFGQEWLQRNRRQVISARSQFNIGLDVFDATINDSEPDSQFFAWRGQASYLRLLSKPKGIPAVGSTILFRSELQLATDPLIPTEQFSLGGATTVRGYRQDTLLTDNGFSAAAELRLPIARFSKLNTSLQFAPFIDFGTGWNTDDRSIEFTTLLGTGVGFILQSNEKLSARIDWGIPLINDNSTGNTLQESGVYLQLQYDLF
ncbi:ShlB/FhaC/HecB family hemolysin secretion/activation protein [Waterburya agarophytonicola K14]|uniref:ShlB/FhaC/HecB family hemolysin secretion/activation protein n=1 Tax=Waterburya agarophytonicola KI4 TaxID=2874699 RepID=A0A964FFS6_9CYAN|nr:ShlB/FhaC/HecB family hemolysin secretion/activation protein [Waterburya agarophytonicola]MCC0175994.1 ShlB/FhaC/HecB family hemolysin secretion/activation protein [Waterburya agarophytonicola KI4]